MLAEEKRKAEDKAKTERAAKEKEAEERRILERMTATDKTSEDFDLMQLLCCFVGILLAESNAFVNHGITWAKIRGLHTLQAAELSVITVDCPRKRRIVVVGRGWA